MGPRTGWLLCAACLLPMLVALLVLQGGRGTSPVGTIDDADSCVAAGAVYLAERDECAFAGDVVVEPGRTLVLDAAIGAFSFHRGLHVEGTLVAEATVTTPDDATITGRLEVRGAGAVRPVSAVRAD